MSKEDKGKVRMTVIHFETESDNETLKENIRSIAHTLTKALSSNSKVIVSKQLTTGDGEVENPELIEEEIDDFNLDNPTSESKSGEKKKLVVRQYRTPQAIDLDLTSGDIPLKEFLEKKNPDSDIKKYLAIAYWFKKYRNIEEVSSDHAYTCYRFMGTGWQIPIDPTRPFRQMKSKPYSWMKAGATKGFYTINHLGENEVEKMGSN